MHEKLNVRFLVRSLLALVLFLAGWFAVHAFQLHRQSQALLDLATRFEKEGRADRALRFLGTYIELEPQDTEARARFGLMMLDQGDQSPRVKKQVMAVFDAVLLRDPERKDIRRRLVELEIDLGEVDDADHHLRVLRESAPEDSELEYLLGLCQAVKAAHEEAAELFRSAIKHSPAHVNSYIELAALLRQHLHKPAEAEKVLDSMVAANPRSYRAYAARAQARKDDREFDKAADDLAKALQLTPADPQVLLVASEVAQARGRIDEARGYLLKGLADFPHEVGFYQAWATLEFAAGRHSQALEPLRKGLQELPDDQELLWSWAFLLIELNKETEAHQAIERLRKTSLPAARLQYLTAYLLLKEEKWSEAQAILETVRPVLVEWPQLTTQCDLLLGQCYQRLGDTDQQFIAYRRVVASNPLSVPGRYGIAIALLRMGRRDDALAEFQQLMTFSNPPPEGWLILARLMIVRNLSVPPAERTWKAVEQALERAAQANPNASEVVLMRAEVLAAQAKLDDARRLLEKARQKQPKDSATWIALAGLAMRQGQPDIGLGLLDEAERVLGINGSIRLARLGALLSHPGSNTAQKVGAVLEGIEKISPADQIAILQEAAEVYYALDKKEEAGRLWRKLAQLRPSNLVVRLHLFELAELNEDEATMKRLLDDIRRVEAEDGPAGHYSKARYLVWLAKHGQREGLEEARRHLTEAAIKRPTWPDLSLCLAEINELESNPEQAIENYLRALRAGDQHLWTIRRVVQLLSERHRYLEAEDIIRQLPEQSPVSLDLQRLMAESSIRTKDYARALAAAKKAVLDQSQDYREHLWLGRMLWAAGQPAPAEAAFRRAVQLAGLVPETWLALIQCLVETGHKDKAEALLAEARGKLQPEQASLTLAQGYELLGRKDKAQELYRATLHAPSETPETIRNVASFYLRTGQVNEAELLLRKLIDLKKTAPAESAWARRTLAVVLAALGDPRQTQEALELLGMLPAGGSKAGPGLTSEEQRARALVLSAHRGQRQRKEAIRLWEDLNTREHLKPNEQFILANLYEMTGDGGKARDLLRKVLILNTNDPGYLATMVNSLLRQGELNEAGLWLDKLQGLPGQGTAATVVSLHSRLLAANGKAGQAVMVVRAFLDGANANPLDLADRLALGAFFLDTLADTYPAEKSYAEAAEGAYRQLAGRSKRPEARLGLAAFLGRQGRLTEALAECERAWATASPGAVGDTCLVVLHAPQAGPQDYQRVERWLQTALERNPKDQVLHLSLAGLRVLQGRHPEAETMYRQVLEMDKKNVVALNNLAWELALSGRTESALEHIDHALAEAGPLPELLDTRAVVYVALGQSGRAIEDLEEVVVDPSLDAHVRASLYFHLAQAYQQLDKLETAATKLKKAQALGLAVAGLHPLERAAYQRMVQQLGAHPKVENTGRAAVSANGAPGQ